MLEVVSTLSRSSPGVERTLSPVSLDTPPAKMASLTARMLASKTRTNPLCLCVRYSFRSPCCTRRRTNRWRVGAPPLLRTRDLRPLPEDMTVLTLIEERGRAQLVELKNGETFNGHLVACDNFMNLTIKEVYQTSAVRHLSFSHASHATCADRTTGTHRTANGFGSCQRRTSGGIT